MAGVNMPGQRNNSAAYSQLGSLAGTAIAGPAGGAVGGMAGGMAGNKPAVGTVQAARSEVAMPQAEQGPDPVMQRRLQELEEVRLASMNKKLYG